MCKVYNKIGSLTTLKERLNYYNITDFKSVKDIIDFKKSYNSLRLEIINAHKDLIESEKETLIDELPKLELELEEAKNRIIDRLKTEIDSLNEEIQILKNHASKNILSKASNSIKTWNLERKVKKRELNFDEDVLSFIEPILDNYNSKKNRLKFIESAFNEAVQKSAKASLREIDWKKRVIDELNNYIYGAIGEQKVVKELEKLSDEYYLINDFVYTVSTALYNKFENDYIKSVQIDHILVGPPGVFLIETKYWSKNSVSNHNLRSPVDQIRRANYALFHLLNSDLDVNLYLNSHHWGTKKLPVKNLIVLKKDRPREEFQYVKVLNLQELLSYINYFKPILSKFETQRIAEELALINNSGLCTQRER